MLDVTQVHPLTEFLRNHKAHLTRLKETRKPQVLTVNGKAEAVLVDAESYQTMVARLERAELIDAIREGIAAAERGEIKPAEQVFAEMRAKYGLPG